MRIAKFVFGSETHWGVLLEGNFYELDDQMYSKINTGNRICSLEDATLLSPIDITNKVPAIAANYGSKDSRDGPGIFLKQPGTYQSHGRPIIYPRSCSSIIHEAELGIVISHGGRHIDEGDALDHVFGYTCVNDVTATEMVSSDKGKGLSMRGKHFDTFCPIGPYIETEVEEPNNLNVECFVNGKISVSGNTSGMIFSIPMLISWVSEVMMLNQGDIIPTGCPGVGELNVGDEVEIRIERIGSLINPVLSDY